MFKDVFYALAYTETDEGYYIDFAVRCSCGEKIDAHFPFKIKALLVTCSKCGRVYRDGEWFKIWLWGKLENYENTFWLRKRLNNAIRPLLGL